VQVSFGLYNLNQLNTDFLSGPLCTDILYGPRRTQTSTNKCAWFSCCKTQWSGL